jgi:hypothetical protein
MEKYLKYTYVNNQLNLYVPEEETELFNQSPMRFNLVFVREKEISNKQIHKELKELKQILLNMTK